MIKVNYLLLVVVLICASGCAHLDPNSTNLLPSMKTAASADTDPNLRHLEKTDDDPVYPTRFQLIQATEKKTTILKLDTAYGRVWQFMPGGSFRMLTVEEVSEWNNSSVREEKLLSPVDQDKADEISADLETLIIPEFEFEEISLADALTFLNEDIKREANNNMTLQGFKITVDEGWKSANPNSGTETDLSPAITIFARSISALETLKTISEIADAKFIIDNMGVQVIPNNVPGNSNPYNSKPRAGRFKFLTTDNLMGDTANPDLCLFDKETGFMWTYILNPPSFRFNTK